MAGYEEIIRTQCSRMDRSIKWWPRYLYHYTDVNHAASIISNEWIYDRITAQTKRLTKTDAASQNVLNVTGDAVKHCGRLYMRPLTPTQYYNEGYKPRIVRNERYKDADCPVPVFFLLDPVKTLEYPGVFFVEGGAAGRYIKQRKSGPDEFSKLRFDKIFHNGGVGHDTSILRYRRTEVLREGGIPLHGLLRRIVCRSPAEARTLLSLMRKQCPMQYEEYSRLVMAAPADIGMRLFFRSGIYIKAAKAKEDQAVIEFNEASLRYDYLGSERKGSAPVIMTAVLSWKNGDEQIIGRSTYHATVDYKKHNGITLSYGQKMSDSYILEVQFDGNLAFLDSFDIGEHSIVY